MVSDDCFIISTDLRKVYDNMQRAILQAYQIKELEHIWVENAEHHILTVKARGLIDQPTQDLWISQIKTAFKSFEETKEARKFDERITEVSDKVFHKILDVTIDCVNSSIDVLPTDTESLAKGIKEQKLMYYNK